MAATLFVVVVVPFLLAALMATIKAAQEELQPRYDPEQTIWAWGA